MALPDWPAYSNDSGDAISGTLLNVAFFDSIEDALEALLYGADNPSVSAVDIIDEVVDARGDEVDLDARLDAMEADIAVPATGTINTDEEVGDIIDEVVDARGNETVLDDRLSGVVDADGVPVSASDSVPGAVTIGAQNFEGVKNFKAPPTFEPGTQSTNTATVSGVVYADFTPRPGTGTSETEASTFTLKGGLLSANGKAIRIRSWGKNVGTATHTRKLFFNGSSLISPATDIVAGGWEFEVIIMRVTASSQVAICRSTTPVTLGVNTATPSVIASYAQTVWDNLAADLTGDVVVKTTVQDSSDGANVVQLGFTIEVLG